ncbi:hypothetical protein [Frankia tisae]|uniref:hypothetical protein n=1 Tax=Frankia tisae TaxID=2950104 RepID=UPI0021C0B3A9|nr:hypothetical protein [Frankia tisae]
MTSTAGVAARHNRAVEICVLGPLEIRTGSRVPAATVGVADAPFARLDERRVVAIERRVVAIEGRLVAIEGRLVAIEGRVDADLRLGAGAELVPELAELVWAHPPASR